MKKLLVPISFALVLLFAVVRPSAGQSIVCDWLDTGTQPSGVTVDGQGNVFVALFAAGEIAEFSQGSCVPRFISTTGPNPNGVAVDNNNNLWVTMEGSDTIEKINISTGNGTSYTVGSNPRGVIFDGTSI